MTRKALVIGNGTYPTGFELTNAINDARAVAEALRRNGFDVAEHTDLDQSGMDAALVDFGRRLEREGAGAFYFAGHGVQVDGENYLVAIDADPTDASSTKFRSLRLDHVLDTMSRAGSETNIVILDACRNDPFGGRWSRSVGAGGLAPVTAPRGTLVAFSTSPGEKSLDGKGSHGRYTEALLQHIDAVCPVETMFKRVRNTMAAASTNRQTPWEHTSLVSEFYFNRSRKVPVTIYSDQAVKDGGFIATPSNPAHVALQGLRTRNWNEQNAAAGALTAKRLNGYSSSECFMIGRALYSAAEGTAKRAETWIEAFISKTSSAAPESRKALLDGMLFEVFFGADGTLRPKPKGRWFDRLFALADVPDLRASFEFIAEVLVATGRHFHAFPDFDAEIAVDVTTQIDAGKTAPAITGVIVGGRDVLSLDYPDYVDDAGVPRYYSMPFADLGEKLATEAALPTLRQALNFPDLEGAPVELRYPLGYSLNWM